MSPIKTNTSRSAKARLDLIIPPTTTIASVPLQNLPAAVLEYKAGRVRQGRPTVGDIMRTSLIVMLASAALIASPALAKKEKKPFVVVNEAVGVPVFPNDIVDRPYEVLGEVKAEVRKATIFSKEASQEKIYRELWERGEKLGADAVVNTNNGDSRVTLMSWGNTAVTGTAVRFVATATPPAAQPASAPAVSEALHPKDAALTMDEAAQVPATTEPEPAPAEPMQAE